MKRPPTFNDRVARLDPEKVRIIRRGLDQGLPAAYYSRVYGISGEQIRRIGRREAWAWVPEDGPVPMEAKDAHQQGPAIPDEAVSASFAKLQDLLKDPPKE